MKHAEFVQLLSIILQCTSFASAAEFSRANCNLKQSWASNRDTVTNPAVYCTATLGPCTFAHSRSPSEAANMIILWTSQVAQSLRLQSSKTTCCRAQDCALHAPYTLYPATSCSHAETGVNAPYHGSLQESTLS